MLFTDRLQVSRTKKLANGYLAGVARIARGGNIQLYRGDEVGRPDLATVRVYRPEDEVFSDEAMRSFANLTMTDDHPIFDAHGVLVDAENWRDHARGITGPRVTRDGEFVEVPYILMDAATVSAVERGEKRELSMGYTSELKWGEGRTAKGEVYDAAMTTIRGNHVAVVRTARGGAELKIGDEEKPMNLRKVIVDGVTYEMNDQTAEVVTKLQGMVTAADGRTATVQAALDAANVKVADTQKLLDASTAQVAALEVKLKDASDPAKLAVAATDHAKLVATATALVPGIKLDGLNGPAIKSAVVISKLGDKAKAYKVEAIDAAFDVLSDGVVVTDTIAQSFSGGQPRTAAGGPVDMSKLIADAAEADRARRAELANAYKDKPEKTN